MSGPPPSPGPQAGGAFVAIAMLVGTGFGVAMRQPSVGFLIGSAVGVAVALAIWATDRRRRG